MAPAALIIKEELGTSDRACVEQITENPYLQHFCGLKVFITDPLLDPPLSVHFRKRFPADVLGQVNNAIAKKVRKKQNAPNNPDDPQSPEIDNKDENSGSKPPANRGKLLVDATCAPADITYPTDLKVLNKARENSEQIIGKLHKAQPLMRDLGLKAKAPRRFKVTPHIRHSFHIAPNVHNRQFNVQTPKGLLHHF